MEVLAEHAQNVPVPPVAAPVKTPATTATVGSGIDDYERDSASSEELSKEELMQLLLPDGAFPLPGVPNGRKQFALAYSNEALVAWVKQRSPGCCGASVASAWNALGGLHRNDAGARSMDDNIEILKDIQADRVRTTRGRVERLLGGLDPRPVVEAVEAELRGRGLLIGGTSKEDCAGKKAMRAAFRAVVFKSFQLEHDVLEEYVHNDEAFVVLRQEMTPPPQPALVASKEDEDGLAGGQEFHASQTIPQRDDTPASSATNVTIQMYGAKVADEAPPSTKVADDIDDEDAVEAVAAPTTKTMDWEKEFMELFNRMAGLNKLCRKRPNTAAFGNWGVSAQVNWLAAESEGLMDLRCTMFMGKKVRGSSVKVLLSSMDRAEDVQAQWLQLREQFTRDDTILLSHHTNHYALIYALREWIECDGTHVRQVLTARKGQRPTAWVDWVELRQTYVKWAGYKLMLIRRHNADRPSKADLAELKSKELERRRARTDDADL